MSKHEIPNYCYRHITHYTHIVTIIIAISILIYLTLTEKWQNGLWKGKVKTRLISMSQVFWGIASYNYKNNLKFDTFIMVFDQLLLVTVTAIVVSN